MWCDRWEQNKTKSRREQVHVVTHRHTHVVTHRHTHVVTHRHTHAIDTQTFHRRRVWQVKFWNCSVGPKAMEFQAVIKELLL